MKAADGTKIAERWASQYSWAKKRLLRYAKAIEELSAAEGRERVLRDALENTAELLNVAMERLGVCGEGDSGQRRADAEFPGGLAALHSARAALATPTPEQTAQQEKENAK